MAMWQHTFGVYVWRPVWRCKLDYITIYAYAVCKVCQTLSGSQHCILSEIFVLSCLSRVLVQAS